MGRKPPQDVHDQSTINALCDFLHASPTPFHAVEQARILLLEAGFQPLSEQDSWAALRTAQSGQGFFCLRGGSLIAWICGSEAPWRDSWRDSWRNPRHNSEDTSASEPAASAPGGLRLAGAHTDSPGLKLKLESAHFERGVLVCHVAVYGSPIFASHCDRSLSVAGIAVRCNGEQSQLRHVHVCDGKAVAIVPNLAIHLNREVNTKLGYNPQTQLKAIFGREPVRREDAGQDAARFLRQKFGLADDEVCELQLCHSERPTRLGLDDELLSGSRLDDMSMVYLLLDEMCQLKRQGKVPRSWPVAILCNGEEVGSRTYEGAASNFVATVLRRIVIQYAQGKEPRLKDEAELIEAWARSLSAAFLLSLDGAHASHPSYPEAFDPAYDLKMGAGPALKLPNGASYISEPFSIARIRAIAQKSNCPLQNAVPRSDRPTGSTIGPILASQLGLRGVDIGLPMYAMHSLQETVAVSDYLSLQRLLREYYLPS